MSDVYFWFEIQCLPNMKIWSESIDKLFFWDFCYPLIFTECHVKLAEELLYDIFVRSVEDVSFDVKMMDI